MRFFRWRSRAPARMPEPPPEFGVRLVLQRGDKIVKRNARGGLEVIRVTADRAEAFEVLRVPPPRP